MKNFYLIILIVLFSCSDNGGNEEPNEAYNKEIESAWSAFETDNYEEAINFFNNAKAKNPDRYEAYLGLTWAILLYNGTTDYSAVVTNANQVLSIEENQTDAIAALAIVQNILKDYLESNLKITSLVSLDNLWSFSKKSSIGVTQLYVIEAQNYFHLANYNSSLSSVKKINPSFTANVSVYSGVIALQNEIERLNNGI